MAKKASLEHDDLDDFEEENVVEAEADSDGPHEPAEPTAPTPPRGRNTGLTISLCVLNVLAAVTFFFLLVLDYQKRQDWSHAVFMNELYIAGLPLKEEDNGPSASRVTLPHQKLDSKKISEVFSLRGGKGGGEFWAIDEPLANRVEAKNLTASILKEYFGSLGAPVKTLEEEIARLKDKVPADIAGAAQETVAALKGKDDKAKRKLASAVLLPLAYDVYQVEKLDEKVKAAKGAALDALIDDAVQRRMLLDILAPCEVFRPGDVNVPFLDKAGDPDQFPLDELKKRLQKRFAIAVADKYDGSVHQGAEWDGEKRLSWEKRQTIGFLLLAIANVHKPDPSQPERTIPLYADAAAAGTPNLPRAQTVLGLYEFAAAAQNLPIAWQTLEQRIIQAIHVDREGFDLVFKDKDGKLKEMDGKPARSQAFIDKYETEIKRIQDLTAETKEAQGRLTDLRDQNKTAKKIFTDRQEHLAAMTKQLIEARAETARKIAELRELQRQLYRAQAELRDAGEQNTRLEQSIREAERNASGAKGAKTP
jgi:hypothetical protein